MASIHSVWHLFHFSFSWSWANLSSECEIDSLAFSHVNVDICNLKQDDAKKNKDKFCIKSDKPIVVLHCSRNDISFLPPGHMQSRQTRNVQRTSLHQTRRQSCTTKANLKGSPNCWNFSPAFFKTTPQSATSQGLKFSNLDDELGRGTKMLLIVLRPTARVG